jgi:hypothetical protein
MPRAFHLSKEMFLELVRHEVYHAEDFALGFVLGDTVYDASNMTDSIRQSLLEVRAYYKNLQHIDRSLENVFEFFKGNFDLYMMELHPAISSDSKNTEYEKMVVKAHWEKMRLRYYDEIQN